jgi:hypothetical protein
VQQSTTLPPPMRGPFLSKFHDLTAGNLDIGHSAQGGSLPPGTPEQVKTAAAHVFEEGFVNAMRVTLWLPIVVLAVGALSVLLVKGRAGRAAGAAAEDAEADKVPVGS